jgi:hypothetical protein
MQKKLRATPHAVSLTAHDDSLARVWYGRMILPPKDAYSPTMGTSYGDVRQLFIDTPQADIPSGLGCSSIDMKAIDGGSRFLDGDEVTVGCADDELYCWFRCMPLADSGLTQNTCAEQNLDLQCASPRDQVVLDGKKHGDYYPSCTNSTQNVTDYPAIPGQPDNCADTWESFYMDDSYEHSFNLTREGDGAFLMWSVVDGSIKARLAFNNVFGWLSTGFADPDGKHKGMNGGHIVMAVPGGNYSAITGLDLDVEASVGSYVIDSDGSAFRHWVDTKGPATNAAVMSTDCFTAISFESDNINGKKFNIEGSDEMIWGGNGEDHFMGHHGRLNRARFTVEWSTGVAELYVPPTASPTVSPTMEGGTDMTSASPRGNFAFLSAFFTLTSIMYLFI